MKLKVMTFLDENFSKTENKSIHLGWEAGIEQYIVFRTKVYAVNTRSRLLMREEWLERRIV